jgi:general secretion pathway protein A
VNLLCDRSLLAGYAEGVRAIGREQVGQAAREILGAHRRTRGWRWLIVPALAAAALVTAGAGLVAWRQADVRDRPLPVSSHAPSSRVPLYEAPAYEPASIAPADDSGGAG